MRSVPFRDLDAIVAAENVGGESRRPRARSRGPLSCSSGCPDGRPRAVRARTAPSAPWRPQLGLRARILRLGRGASAPQAGPARRLGQCQGRRCALGERLGDQTAAARERGLRGGVRPAAAGLGCDGFRAQRARAAARARPRRRNVRRAAAGPRRRAARRTPPTPSARQVLPAAGPRTRQPLREEGGAGPVRASQFTLYSVAILRRRMSRNQRIGLIVAAVAVAVLAFVIANPGGDDEGDTGVADHRHAEHRHHRNAEHRHHRNADRGTRSTEAGGHADRYPRPARWSAVLPRSTRRTGTPW